MTISIALVLGFCWIIKLFVGSNSYTLSRLVILMSLIWFILCAIGFSDAGSNIPLIVVSVYISLAWVMIWVIRLWRKRFRKSDLNTLKRPLLYWLLIPSAIVLPLLLGYLDVFSLIRFKLSEQALCSYVGNVRAGKVDLAFEFDHPPRQIGLYTVTVTDLLPDGTVRFITSSHGIFDKAGFAHSPKHSPPVLGEDSYKQINQQWWYYYQSW
ncbi:MAG: hypothetical protein HOP02_08145 [Methylococcaceae bacterium]|nr:hypothetical protein [Methylococcaceae bacterium]